MCGCFLPQALVDTMATFEDAINAGNRQARRDLRREARERRKSDKILAKRLIKAPPEDRRKAIHDQENRILQQQLWWAGELSEAESQIPVDLEHVSCIRRQLDNLEEDARLLAEHEAILIATDNDNTERKLANPHARWLRRRVCLECRHMNRASLECSKCGTPMHDYSPVALIPKPE